MIRIAGIALLGLVLAVGATAEDLDDLFNDLENGIPASPPERNLAPDSKDRPLFLYFGNLETQGILAGGFTDEARQSNATSLYYYLHLQGGIDVMPIPEARLIGSFSTYLPQDLDSGIIATLKDGNTQKDLPGSTVTSVNTGSSLSLDELYLDYAILKSAIFRIGKFAVTWGQGRLFNPGNLVADSSGAINLRAFAPLGPFTFTGMVIGNSGFFAQKTKPKAEELGYAGNLELTLGSFSASVSGYHELLKGSTVDLAFRTGLLGFDLYTEGLAHHLTGDQWIPSLVAGTYREFNFGVKFTAVAEYWLDGKPQGHPSGDFERSFGLAMSTGSLFPEGDLKFSAKWLHSLTDGSGQLVTGLTATPLPKLEIALGIPWTYGPATGSYVTGNSDPEKRLLAAMLSVRVKLDFEKDR